MRVSTYRHSLCPYGSVREISALGRRQWVSLMTKEGEKSVRLEGSC
jgi:hypothetical protein